MAKLPPSFYCYSHFIIMGNSCAYLKYFLFSIFSLTKYENTGSDIAIKNTHLSLVS